MLITRLHWCSSQGVGAFLCAQLSTYVRTLERTAGAVPEFVNPKYADDSRASFTSPTRLECMMQAS